ncbi:tetratricopeptide repeat protein [Helicobacter pylori]|uniref:tetratricopeptide repeat protein n=1 Tax=Helicobacter pylori TaxID=210 RepID=UPI000958AF12|nr:tetratricopeptide repeat protein [Helicobacter pylori]BAW60207.1 hsp12 variant C [Helicobacter pylori]BAW68096.1 hsp12 variant C [Helicobacter pylori]
MAEQDSKELILSGITIYTDKNSTRAKKYFEKACGLNDADGCIILREIYSKAITRENARESIKKALEHTATAKACKLNDAEKCKKLAEFYFKANDLKKTLEYYSKSCKLNDAKGCYALVALYNEGVAKDEKQMTESLKKACGLGLKEACDILKEQK